MFAESAFASSKLNDSDADSSEESDEDDFFQPKTSSSSASENLVQASAAIVTDSAKSRRGDSSSKWTLEVRDAIIDACSVAYFFLQNCLAVILVLNV